MSGCYDTNGVQYIHSIPDIVSKVEFQNLKQEVKVLRETIDLVATYITKCTETIDVIAKEVIKLKEHKKEG